MVESLIAALWDVKSGNKLRELDAHEKMVGAFSFHPTGKLLASASWDFSVKLWGLPESLKKDE